MCIKDINVYIVLNLWSLLKKLQKAHLYSQDSTPGGSDGYTAKFTQH